MAKPLKEKVKIFEVAISLQEISPINTLAKVQRMTCTRSSLLGFSGGSVENNLPAEDTGLAPDLGRSHTWWSNRAREPQLLSQFSTAREPQPRALPPLEPRLWNKGSHRSEELTRCNRAAACSTDPEKGPSATKTQDSQHKWIELFLQKTYDGRGTKNSWEENC